MANTVEDLIELQDAGPVVKTRLPLAEPEPLLARAFALLDQENSKVPPGRQILRSILASVVAEELVRYEDLPEDAAEFATLRGVQIFLSTAQNGLRESGSMTPYTDLLPVGNPASTARSLGGVTASAYNEARAEWESSHPKLTDELRPLVASAFRAAPGTVEYIHATARLRAVRSGLIPSDVLASL